MSKPLKAVIIMSTILLRIYSSSQKRRKRYSQSGDERLLRSLLTLKSSTEPRSSALFNTLLQTIATKGEEERRHKGFPCLRSESIPLSLSLIRTTKLEHVKQPLNHLCHLELKHFKQAYDARSSNLMVTSFFNVQTQNHPFLLQARFSSRSSGYRDWI